jgi:hypothetical protein
MNNITLILKSLEYLKNKFKLLTFKESEEILEITFEGILRDFIEFANKDMVEKCFESQLYNFTVKYDMRYLTRSDLLKPLAYDTNKTCTLDFICDKTALTNQNKNVLFFFSLDSFVKRITPKNRFFLEPKKQKFIFIPIDKTVSNGFIELIPLDEFSIHETYDTDINDEYYEKVKKIDEIIKEYTHLTNSNLPTPFLFLINANNDYIQKYFDRALFEVILHLLANKSGDNHFLFRGYQNVDLVLKDDFFPTNTEILLELFNFIYDKDKFLDKLEIFRNVLTLYIKDTDDISLLDKYLPKIRSTVEHHFTAYIQDKIEKFFDQRKDIVKEAYNAALEAKNYSDKIFQAINLSIIGIITAGLTGIFAYSRGDKFIFILALAFHGIYFLISWIVNFFNYNGKKEDIEKTFDSYTEQFSVLSEEEIKSIKSSYLEPALTRLKNILTLYCFISIGLVIIMFFAASLVSIIIGNK